MRAAHGPSPAPGAPRRGAGPRAAPRMTSIYVTPFSKCFDIYKAPSTQNTKYYSTDHYHDVDMYSRRKHRDVCVSQHTE